MKLRKILAILLLAAVVTSSVGATAVSAADEAVLPPVFPDLTIGEVIDFDNPAYVGGDLDIAGKTVILRQGLEQSADIHLHGGQLIIVGDYKLIEGTIYTEGGSVTVSGDMTVYSGLLKAGFADDDETAAENGGSVVVSGLFTQSGGTVSGGNGLVSAQSGYKLIGGTLTAASGKVSITGALTQSKGTVNGENGTIEISGNYDQTEGKLVIGSGNVTVGGNYTLAKVSTDENGEAVYNSSDGVLKMTEEEGHFTVCGDFLTRSYYGGGSSDNYLTNGTLELKGDFTQLIGYYQSNFNAGIDHKVIFTGDKKQTVSFESPTECRFGTILPGSNTDVDIVSGNIANVSGDVTVASLAQYGDLNLRGNKLTVTGDVVQNGNISLSSGNFNVGGSWLQQDGELDIFNGSLIIDGDYTIGKYSADEDGNITLASSGGVLKMDDENDYMCVGGNFTTKSYYGNGTGSGNNYLTNGTLELKGDFTQLYGYYTKNFYAEKGHKVKFTGDKKQTVSFERPNECRFGTILPGSNTNVDIVSGNIASVGGNVTIASFAQYGSLDISGNKLTVTGNVTQNGDITVNSGTFNVVGDWLQQGGDLALDNGSLTIDGDYTIGKYSADEDGNVTLDYSGGVLKMDDENDYMCVGGNFTTKSYYGNGSGDNYLTKGTLELKGDFTQLSGYYQSNFYAEKGHKVIFTGDKKQTVSFETPTECRFGTILPGSNTNVDIISGNIASVDGEVTIANFAQYGSLDVNGNKLTVTGNVTQNGNISVNLGTFNVGGSYLHQGGSLAPDNGSLIIDGDYTIGKYSADTDGNVTLAYSGGTLKMDDENDYMCVGGNFTTKSYYGNGTGSGDNYLTKGTLELKGDFTQLFGYYQSNFYAEKGHKVIFTGDKKQIVSFETPENCRFGTILPGSNTDVDIVSGNIASVDGEVTIANFAQFGELDISGNKLNVTGNVTQNGNIFVNLGTFNVGGSYLHQGGSLAPDNGSLIIDGDYTIGKYSADTDGNVTLAYSGGVLKMDDENDYMCVGGNFTTKSYYGNGTGSGNNYLTNGTLELKGNFTQLSGYYQKNFYAEKGHKVIFTGDKKQTVSFETPINCRFGTILPGSNTNVDIVSGNIAAIGGDVTVANLTQYGDLDVNGNKLTVTGNVTENGNISVSGGTVDVKGSWDHLKGALDLNNGMVRIAGDFTIAKVTTDDEGNRSFASSDGVLKMNDARDYMLVEGDFTTKSHYGNGSGDNDFTNGVLEVKGDFTELHGYYNGNFSAGINHVTVLSGDEGQKITFGQKTSHFGQLAVCTVKHDENFYDIPYEDYSYYLNYCEYDHAIGISTLSGTSVKRGESVDLLARVTMAGTTCVYAVYVSIDGGAEEQIGSYIGPNFGITYTPPRAGEYTFRVYAITSDLHTVEQTLLLTVNPADELTTGASLSKTEITEGESVTVKTNVKGGVAPYGYSYAYRAAGEEGWTSIDSSDTSAVFTPAAGSYEVKVTVTDTDKAKAETVLALKVNPDTADVVNNSTINATALTIGSRLKMTGAAEGGDGNYTYTYSYKRTTSRVWSVIGTEDTTEAEAFMTPSSAGTFDIKIIAKDGAGKTAEQTFTLTVSDGKSEAFKNKSSISITGAKPGTKVTMTGKAEGSSGYRYAYYYKRTSARTWTILGEEFGTSTTYSFTPRTPGEFNIKIDVIDENGEIVSRMFALSISDDYVDTTIINNSKVSASSVVPGTKVTLTGAAEGGAGGYTYAYYYKKQNATNWTVLGTEFSASAAQSFTPRTLGSYIVKIAVKDAEGGMTSKNFDLEITNDPKPEEKELENTSTISATNITAGTTVQVTGAAENGTAPYTFTYYYKKAAALKWTEMTSADGSSASLKLRNAGDYNFRTVVTDAEGEQAERTFNVKVS